MKFDDAVKLFVGTIIVLVFIGVALQLFGFNVNMDKIINWIIPFGVGLILSAFVGEWIESLTGDFFKNIMVIIPIGKYEFSISAFVVLVIVLKIWIF